MLSQKETIKLFLFIKENFYFIGRVKNSMTQVKKKKAKENKYG